MFELLLWVVTSKQRSDIEINVGKYWHSDAIVITSDSWWIYDIEQVSEGIRFSTRRVGNDRLAKNYSLGNLKRCFGAVFDETNFRTDLNSPELTEFLKDARAVYYHNRQNR